MKFGKGVIFILTKDDIINLAKEAGIPEHIVDDKFLHYIEEGVSDLITIQIKRFMRELTG